jgi:DNA-binding transcriptional ArsR family regulator
MPDSYSDGFQELYPPKPPSETKRLAHMAGLFRALSDPLRLRIYELAWSVSPVSITIGQLVERTGAKQSLVSFHVKKLVEVELLVRDGPAHRRSGFRIHGTSIADIARWVNDLGDDSMIRSRLPGLWRGASTAD